MKLSVDIDLLSTLVTAYDAWAGSKPLEEQDEYLAVTDKLRHQLVKAHAKVAFNNVEKSR